MGEARRKKLEREAALDNLQRLDLANVAAAVRKLFMAASNIQGSDCYGYAAHGQQLLKRLGVASEIAVGYAIWRVGGGDLDTVAHHPNSKVNYSISGYAGHGVLYHAWLEVAGRILDLTTHTLPRKAALVDAFDGYQTAVDWCPDYLFADKQQVLGFERVLNGRSIGLFHYQRVPELEREMRTTALPLDEAEMATIWMLYQQPEMRIAGPMTERERWPSVQTSASKTAIFIRHH